MKEGHYVKIIGIAGCYKRDGITKQMLDQVLANVGPENEVEQIFLLDHAIYPGSPDLDKLVEKLKQADVWVLAAPTYWGALSGVMKNFLDCLRQVTLRFDKNGDLHPIEPFEHKHYVLLTNCYAKTWENMFTGTTDAALRTMDKVMTTLGLIKAGEAVQTDTYFLTALSAKKQVELQRLGQKAGTLQRKDDQTVKRYIELFFIVAAMAFITMLIQTGVLHLLGQTLGFWNNYISFVVIFFILLSITLHFFTVVKHKRK